MQSASPLFGLIASVTCRKGGTGDAKEKNWWWKMENISYIGLSQQMALKQQMDISANNLANINTPGFKSQSILFLEYLNKPKQGEGVKQVLDFGSYRDLSAGALRQTYNDLDVALHGDGYFAVQTEGGTTRYTRDGSFSLNASRELVNKSGYKVMGDGGPIVVQEGASKITITADGTVSTNLGEIGKLKVVTFDQPQKLVEIGENLYDGKNQPEKPVERLKVVQGSLEGANVNPVVEMNKMIEILRSYQATQRMLMNDHERIRSAIQKLTRV